MRLQLILDSSLERPTLEAQSRGPALRRLEGWALRAFSSPLPADLHAPSLCETFRNTRARDTRAVASRARSHFRAGERPHGRLFTSSVPRRTGASVEAGASSAEQSSVRSAPRSVERTAARGVTVRSPSSLPPSLSLSFLPLPPTSPHVEMSIFVKISDEDASLKGGEVRRPSPPPTPFPPLFSPPLLA